MRGGMRWKAFCRLPPPVAICILPIGLLPSAFMQARMPTYRREKSSGGQVNEEAEEKEKDEEEQAEDPPHTGKRQLLQ